MLRVGLTGGIASGKTTVCKAFASLGAIVFDIDEIAREVVQPGRAAWVRLRQIFGLSFFHADGSLDRLRLRKLVFAEPELLRRLNEVVHPEVMREIQRRSEQTATLAPDSVLLVDVPLLFEVGAEERFDQVVVVYVAESLQVERLMLRDGLSMAEASQALGTQIPLDEKVAGADFVIDNGGTAEETLKQVEVVWQELLTLAGGEVGT